VLSDIFSGMVREETMRNLMALITAVVLGAASAMIGATPAVAVPITYTETDTELL
jgi:hypothetical protein